MVAVVVGEPIAVRIEEPVSPLHARLEPGASKIARPVVDVSLDPAVWEASLGQAVGVVVVEDDVAAQGVAAADQVALAGVLELPRPAFAERATFCGLEQTATVGVVGAQLHHFVRAGALE